MPVNEVLTKGINLNLISTNILKEHLPQQSRREKIQFEVDREGKCNSLRVKTDNNKIYMYRELLSGLSNGGKDHGLTQISHTTLQKDYYNK